MYRRPSSFKILWLFARTAVRRTMNCSAAWKFGRQSPDSTTVREATLHRDQRTSRGRRLGGLALILLMLFGELLLTASALPVLVGSIRLEEMQGRPTIALLPQEFERLQQAAAISDETARQDELNRVFPLLIDSTGWVAKSVGQLARERFESAGLNGFESVAPESPWRGNLAMLTPNGRLKALRAVGLFLLVLNLTTIGVGLGLMNRNLSNADPNLHWLMQFPVSHRTLMFAKLAANVLETPSAVKFVLLSGMLLWGCGLSFGVGFGLAVAFGLSAAIAGAAVRLALEMFLLQKCRRKTRGTVVGLASILGSMGIFLAIACANVQAPTELLVWLANRVPDGLFWNPFSHGFGTVSLVGAVASGNSVESGWWLVAPVTAVLLAIAAVMGSASLIARGLATGQDAARHDGLRSRSVPATSWFRGTVWKELVQIRRQRELLVQIVSAPAFILFLVYLNAPAGSFERAVHDARILSVSVFIGASYLLLVAASQVLRSELQTLWFLQSQPRPIADSFRAKARVWAGVAIVESVLLIGLTLVLLPEQRLEMLVRVPLLLASLWFLAEIQFGWLTLSATIVSERNVRIRWGANLLPLLLVAVTANAIFHGQWWDQGLVLSMLVVLGLAVRQKQQAKLAWLSEPVETPPRRLYALHGLLAIIGFRFLQDMVAGVALAAGLSLPEVMTVAYCVGSLVVGVLSWWWLRRTGLPLRADSPSDSTAISPWRPIGIGLAVSCAAAFLLISVLQATSAATGSAVFDLRSPAATRGNWLFAGMVVLVAPVFEEWLFRGLLYQSLRRSWGMWTCVVLTSVFFTLLHPILSSLGVFTLAITTAIVAEKTRRLWPSMVIHIGYNLFVVAMWNRLV